MKTDINDEQLAEYVYSMPEEKLIAIFDIINERDVKELDLPKMNIVTTNTFLKKWFGRELNDMMSEFHENGFNNVIGRARELVQFSQERNSYMDKLFVLYDIVDKNIFFEGNKVLDVVPVEVFVKFLKDVTDVEERTYDVDLSFLFNK